MRIFATLTSDFHVGFGSFTNKLLNLYILGSSKMYVGGLEAMLIVSWKSFMWQLWQVLSILI